MSTAQKVCVITGASSGIGFAIAESLKQSGNYKLVVTARRTDRLSELSSPHGDILPGDITNGTASACQYSKVDDIAKGT